MDGISSINMFLYNNIQKVSQDSFNIDGLSLYMTFAILFYGSDGNSHIELKKYFGYPDKNIVNDEITDFIGRNAKYIYPYFSFRSYVINDRFIPLSKNFAKASTIVPFIPVNISNSHNEAGRLNTIFESETGAPNIISKKTLQKTQISVINISRLTPVWGIPVDAVVMDKFMGIKTEFLQFAGQSVGLLEDADKLMIEIPMKGLKMLFGVILHKESLKGRVDQSDIEMAISNMKDTVVDEILLPKIVKRVKMRLNTMLETTGLNVIFMDTDLPKIYPERGGNLNNIIQYCDIIIDEKSVRSTKKRGGNYQSMRRIVIDRSFTYYIRYAPEKVILSMGYID
jgi:serine protease inhibitor